MSNWEIFWIVVAVVLVLVILLNLRDLIRYFKIRSM